MTSQLAPRQNDLPTIEPQSESVALMHIIERCASDQAMDVEKLERLLDVKRQWEADAARKAFAEARAEFQAQCPPIRKTGKARVRMKSGGEYSYTFPPLDEIMATIKPHLESTGLSISFSDFDLKDGQLELSCIITHRGGHSERYPFRVPVDPTLSINDMQKVGVSNSYCRRYALSNALALVGVDADTDGALPPANTISAQQAATIRDHLEALEVDETEFCTFLKFESVDAIPANGFNRAMNAIKAKQRKLEKGSA